VKTRAEARGVSSRVLCALLALPSLVLGVTIAEPAAAQSVSIPSTAPIRRFPARRSGLPVDVITHNDCLDDGTLEVVLNLSQTSDLDLQIWSGTSSGCANDDQRATLGDRCQLIDSFNPDQTSHLVTLRVRDILPIAALTTGSGSGSDSRTGGEGGSGGDSGTGGAPPEPTDPAPTGSDICESGIEGPFSVFFLLVDGTQTAASATLSLRADLEGPDPPSDLSVGLGEGRLFIGWGQGTNADDLLGYRVFCEPASDPEVCAAPSLVTGQRPPRDLEVGRAAQTSTEAPASGLENGTTYACGVSGMDTYDNVGPLSELVCGTPEPVQGYFEAYRRAGGQAGGGICSFDGPGRGAGGFLGAAFVGALALLRRARGGGRR